MKYSVFRSGRLAAQVTYFASGTNRPGEIEGLAAVGVDVGSTSSELSSGAFEALASLRDSQSRVFIDTGAFSEVEFRPHPVVVAPISDEDFARRLEVAFALAGELGPKLYAVAPDMVGFQRETIARLARWAPWARAVRERGSRLIVCFQRGAMSAREFFESAREAIGFGDFVIGIPCKKAATSPAQLAALCRELAPRRLHLLGVGPRSPRFAELHGAVKAFAPGAQVSCDSVLVRARVGRTNGRGGGPREITRALDEALEDVREAMWAEGVDGGLDWTEALESADGWLSLAARERIADAAELQDDERAQLASDPRAFFQDGERYMCPLLESAFANEWRSWVEREGSARWRKREGIIRAIQLAPGVEKAGEKQSMLIFACKP